MSEEKRTVAGEVMDGSSALTPNPQNPTPIPVPILPEPKRSITIRPGVLDDYPFIDDLQKQHKKAVGFMWEAAIKGHIEKGNVLVAEAGPGSAPGMVEPRRREGHEDRINTDPDALDPQHSDGIASCSSSLRGSNPMPVGYLIGVDRYLKRDELGIIYQMNVVPEYQRSLVAANLLKEKFERSAYGCRLYCCWCAQDLAANKFWEAMGFVPLAFRTGGGRRKKEGPRMHIFWQKRIRENDTETNYWFPSQTGAGAIGEDRIVLPIPPGTHWSDAKPVVLPEGPSVGEEAKLLEARVSELQKAKKAARTPGSRKAQEQSKKRPKVKAVQAGGLHFGERLKSVEEQEVERITSEAHAKQEQAAKIEAELKEAKKAAKRAKKKFDPAQEAFARELKDRWLEQVAAQPGLLAASAARYDVSRQIQATAGESIQMDSPEQLQLPDAA